MKPIIKQSAFAGMVVGGAILIAAIATPNVPDVVPTEDSAKAATAIEAMRKDLVVHVAAKDVAPPKKSVPATTPPETPTATARGFEFGDDAAGKSLNGLLPPTPKERVETATRPVRKEFVLPKSITQPEPPTAPIPLDVPRLAVAAGVAPRPDSLPERAEPVSTVRITQLPQQERFPEWKPTAIPATNLAEPSPLTFAPKPVTERASLDDPAMEYSVLAVQNPKLPLRTTPADFVPINLPTPSDPLLPTVPKDVAVVSAIDPAIRAVPAPSPAKPPQLVIPAPPEPKVEPKKK